LTLLSHTVSVSLSLSLISLSPLLTDAQSQQDLPQTPAPHQPSKAKVGAVLREATQKILTRLMTEDPISIGELQQSCNELPPEQTQDILDVHSSLALALSVSLSLSLCVPLLPLSCSRSSGSWGWSSLFVTKERGRSLLTEDPRLRPPLRVLSPQLFQLFKTSLLPLLQSIQLSLQEEYRQRSITQWSAMPEGQMCQLGS
jgi:hypothetical protein